MQTKIRKLPAILALLPLMAAGFSFLPAAYAQTSPSGKCVAPVPPGPGQNNGHTDNSQDLAQKLDSCNGELKAPPVGDGQMVEPAPDTGNSRVIKPGEVPSNNNPSNGSGG
ncbi:hypothetical protein KX729_13925 [Rhizobium sp. XQZ8]|uniref:hypothetical protein n=1 Tax=Rhizobium populisoli TaxID=2859785 RepID=UPI001CA5B478|nr:hypothetical protein [Rhizobium populisoli]MBW6422551.1 hypothetical protein [Rhizobium populisoli]